jgi:DNA-binding NarL/FixJ family response regulator
MPLLRAGPTAYPERAWPSLQQSTEVENRPIHVLIVDDERLVGEALAAALGGESDLEIVGVAHTAAESKRIARRTQPDVVVLDRRLPDVNGASVARELVSAQPEVKVVLVVDREDHASLLDAVDSGCQGLVSKSARGLAELEHTVRAVHAGSAVLPMSLIRQYQARPAPGDALPFGLTPREMDVLRCLAAGMSTVAIAEYLTIKVNTVRHHTQAIISKLGAHSKLEAVSTAIREGIVHARDSLL